MKFSSDKKNPPEDSWVWGKEQILFGYDPSHSYTIKVLKPEYGRKGCLSLQYHHYKSESWFVHSGAVWALIIQNGELITRIMNSGDYQNLPAGTIHRLMGVDGNVSVIECSTPDAHAADKSAKKDVVRLHCVLGRECENYQVAGLSKEIFLKSVELTEEAISLIEEGKIPESYNLDQLVGGAVVG